MAGERSRTSHKNSLPATEIFVPNILIDVTRLVYRRLKGKLPTGIDRVSIEYIRRYALRKGQAARAVLSLGPFNAVLSAQDSAAMFAAVDRAESMTGLALVVIAKAFLWRWWCLGYKSHYLFNAGHMGLENPRYAWSLRVCGARPMFVVSDLIPITHPEYCRPGERERHRVRMRVALSTGSGIVTISQDTLNVLRRFATSENLAMPPAVAAPLAPGLPDIAAGPRPLAPPYFVVVGTIEPRKNHLLLLQLWRQMVEQLGDAAPRLVVIGQRGWECENVVDLLERCAQLKGFVIEQPYCSDAALITWMHHAQALLFPTFAEGYGMPLTEALSIGVPVIASELSVFRETSGDVPEYANPLDGRRWQELILDYAKADSTLRAAQLERMKDFRATTWEQHFEKVDALLESLEAGQATKAGT